MGDENTAMFCTTAARVRGNDYRQIPHGQQSFEPMLPVSVIIPYYDAPAELVLLLACIKCQTYPGELLEVVIVDDGSPERLRLDDLPPELAKGMNLIITRQSRDGFGLARARNRGSRVASHRLQMFLDGDMLIPSGFVAAHARWHHRASNLLTLSDRKFVDVSHLTHERIPESGGNLPELLRGSESDSSWLAGYLALTNGMTRTHDDIFRAVVGANFCLTKDSYWKVGGQDESFVKRGMQDTEFGYRAYTRGLILVHEPETCWHQGRRWDGRVLKDDALRLASTKCEHLIAHPSFRHQSGGRSFTVPQCIVRIAVGGVDELSDELSVEAAYRSAATVLADRFHDLVVKMDVGMSTESEWVRNRLGSDPRVRFERITESERDAVDSRFYVFVHPGALLKNQPITWLVKRIGDRVGLQVRNPRQPHQPIVSITRTWAINRSAETGQSFQELGKVGLMRRRSAIWGRARGSGVRWPTDGRLDRVFDELTRSRTPGDFVGLLRWLVNGFRSYPPSCRKRRGVE